MLLRRSFSKNLYYILYENESEKSNLSEFVLQMLSQNGYDFFYTFIVRYLQLSKTYHRLIYSQNCMISKFKV